MRIQGKSSCSFLFFPYNFSFYLSAYDCSWPAFQTPGCLHVRASVPALVRVNSRPHHQSNPRRGPWRAAGATLPPESDRTPAEAPRSCLVERRCYLEAEKRWEKRPFGASRADSLLVHVGPGAARSRPCLQDGAGPASPAFPWESPGIYLDADTFSLRSYVLTVRGPWMRPPCPGPGPLHVSLLPIILCFSQMKNLKFATVQVPCPRPWN